MDPFVKELLEKAGEGTVTGIIGHALRIVAEGIKGRVSKAEQKKLDQFARKMLVSVTDADVRAYDPKYQHLEQRIGRASKKASAKFRDGRMKTRKASAKRVSAKRNTGAVERRSR